MPRISYNGRRLVAVVKQARAVDAFKHQQQKNLADEARREFSDIFTVSELKRLTSSPSLRPIGKTPIGKS